jgi:hypothetical protein
MPYVVMVRCPNADMPVSTGIHCDIKGFSGLTDSPSLDCPECGQVHQWSVTDAWLRGAAWHERAEVPQHRPPKSSRSTRAPVQFSGTKSGWGGPSRDPCD